MSSSHQLDQLCFLCLAIFGHFDTIPDGWLGWEKIKNKDQISLAEA